MDQNLEEQGNHKPPHCLILPYPFHGHLNIYPMLQFPKSLAHNGIELMLTAVKRQFRTPEQFPGVVFVEAISDGFSDGFSGNISLQEPLASFNQVGRETFSELLEKLGSSERHVDYVIYDPFLPWGHDVAMEFGLLTAAFFT